MEKRKNFLALILLDALDDENEEDIFRILDKNGVDAGYVPQERGISPLHYSCGMENKSLAIRTTKQFLEANADPDTRSDENMTPLHVAALNGRQEIVALLLQHGASLDVLDDERKTPIHYAIEACHFEVVQMMRDHISAQKAKEKQDRQRKLQQKQALENSSLTHTKFENSLQQRVLGEPNKVISTPQKNVSFANDSPRDIPKLTLNLPPTSNAAEAKSTPQRISYNYDVTSPYYINITHRRHQRQPSYPQEATKDVEGGAVQEADAEDIIDLSSTSAENSPSPAKSPSSQAVNIFSLTKENLDQFARYTPEQHTTRLSLINVWRSKVAKTRARQSILREFDDVPELVDEVMSNEHLNFSNTRLKEPAAQVHVAEAAAKASGDSDSGACSLYQPEEKPRESATPSPSPPPPSPPLNKKRPCGHMSLGQIIERVAQAHLVDSNPPPKHTPSPPHPYPNAERGDELESSYQTVPEAKPMDYLAVPRQEPLAGSPSPAASTESNAASKEINFIRSPKSNEYFLQMAEAYVHTDDENGLVFYETKLLANQANVKAEQRRAAARHEPKTPGRAEHLDTTATSQSTNLTIPLDYETDALRSELTTFGEPPGPITKSTKRLYIKRLIKYKRKVTSLVGEPKAKQADKENCPEQKFSVELYRTLRSAELFAQIKDYAKYESESAAFFTNHQNKKEMREGHLKQSFIYMLIDPRISCNLPGEALYMDKFEVWRRFLRSVFYVGKGKTSRPYCHLYDAMKTHSRMHMQELRTKENGKKVSIRKQPLNADIFKSPPAKSSDSKKLDRILDIWAHSHGVVCLHVFHNIMPAEAYTREAAIIEALSLRHLTNVKKGDYYGPAKTWTMKEKKYLGIALLYKAMQIYLAEGESQLSPSDLI